MRGHLRKTYLVIHITSAHHIRTVVVRPLVVTRGSTVIGLICGVGNPPLWLLRKTDEADHSHILSAQLLYFCSYVRMMLEIGVVWHNRRKFMVAIEIMHGQMARGSNFQLKKQFQGIVHFSAMEIGSNL